MDVVSAKAASKGVEIVFWNQDGDEVNDWILGDSTRFRQIVINCKYTFKRDLVIESCGTLTYKPGNSFFIIIIVIIISTK
jgi:hypothetical protein